ncbi:MAG: hypothetical protein ACXAEU_24225 [Candidatus Hodarchaeales archaeon]
MFQVILLTTPSVITVTASINPVLHGQDAYYEINEQGDRIIIITREIIGILASSNPTFE